MTFELRYQSKHVLKIDAKSSVQTFPCQARLVYSIGDEGDGKERRGGGMARGETAERRQEV